MVGVFVMRSGATHPRGLAPDAGRSNGRVVGDVAEVAMVAGGHPTWAMLPVVPSSERSSTGVGLNLHVRFGGVWR
eukprot:5901840-Prorocentrum_lima.AAC.1